MLLIFFFFFETTRKREQKRKSQFYFIVPGATLQAVFPYVKLCQIFQYPQKLVPKMSSFLIALK